MQDLSHILRRPRITEKASRSAEVGVYVFEVAERATKQTIATAVKQLYNVTARKVAIARIPDRQVLIRNKKGLKTGGKKAYVHLKKGDKIEIV